MEVILLSDVEKLGLRGEVVDVAARVRPQLPPAAQAGRGGDARTRGRDPPHRRASAPATRRARPTRPARSRRCSTKTVLRFEVKAGPTGALFGSVTPTDIAEELWRTRKIRVDRRKIDLDAIKRIGRYSIPIHVFEDVTAEVKTLVVPEGGELPPEEELAALEAAERGRGARPPTRPQRRRPSRGRGRAIAEEVAEPSRRGARRRRRRGSRRPRTAARAEEAEARRRRARRRVTHRGAPSRRPRRRVHSRRLTPVHSGGLPPVDGPGESPLASGSAYRGNAQRPVGMSGQRC